MQPWNSIEKDNDKKPQDNNAKRQKKNEMREKNRQAGKHQFSKETDHL
ncbi:DUF3941 domain-containing protein [Calidifontibacillus erzurumensis]|uniref:DUF3941 domain-containing protein n=1 Tax=Calidifontibacillus erzurumensis TaxID=2741433 RepID=A0A8J8GD71_9BACI|nr:DUF3941 domain-containing protein [Calidifontibacillus erzurumensis]NSL51512.1 DUF3941 domain-containing protein [Calidifontibacillus erzurumensis]